MNNLSLMLWSSWTTFFSTLLTMLRTLSKGLATLPCAKDLSALEH